MSEPPPTAGPTSTGSAPRRRLLLVARTLLAVAICTAAPTPASAGTGGYLLDHGDADATRTAALDYIVLQPWEGHRIAAMKRTNPRVRILMYKNLTAVRSDSHESGMYSTGVSYDEAARHRWLLRDLHGRVIEWSDWPGLHPADIAARAYQDRWVANTLQDLRRARWDGVLLDDTLSRLSHTTFGGARDSRYATDRSMRAATTEFLARVGPALRRSGYEPYANVTDVDARSWRSVLTNWRPHVSGYLHEFFVRWGHGGRGPRFSTADDWVWKYELAAWAADQRLPLLVVTYSDPRDRRTQRYHRATWLLTWNGSTGASIFSPDADHVDHVTRASTVSVGQPAGKVREVRGLYVRSYRRGLVVVNPSERPRTLHVGRAPRILRGTGLRRLRVAPQDAAILRRR